MNKSRLQNILIIEDQPNDIDLIKYYLKKAFPDLILNIAQSIQEYREKIEWLTPDLVLSDFDLPDGNGLEILLEIKEKSDIPVIFVSGTLDEGTIAGDAILGGANGYVLKDGMRHLPEQIGKVMDSHDEKIEQEKKRKKTINDIKLQTQKVIAMVQPLNDTEQIVSILQTNLSKLDEL